MKILVAAILIASLSVFLAGPVVAQDTCQFNMTDTIASLSEQGVPHVIIAEADAVQKFVDEVAEPIVGAEVEGATAVLLANLPQGIAFGLEVDGCLLPPVIIPGLTALPAKLSGKMPDGSVHA